MSVDDALNAVVVALVSIHQVVQEVHVVPGVVVIVLMEHQILASSSLQSSSRQTTDEALIDLVIVVDVSLSTQLSEGIDDHTKNYVEQDGDDYQEES